MENHSVSNLVKLNTNFVNIDFKEYAKKGRNKTFISTLLLILQEFQKSGSPKISININKEIPGLTRIDKYTLQNTLRDFKIIYLESKQLKKEFPNNNLLPWIIDERKSRGGKINLILTDDFINFFKLEKKNYVNVNTLKINEVNSWNDYDFLIYIYSLFSAKTKLFKNKHFSFITNRIKLSKTKEIELKRFSHINLRNTSITMVPSIQHMKKQSSSNKKIVSQYDFFCYPRLTETIMDKTTKKVRKVLKRNLMSAEDFIKSSKNGIEEFKQIINNETPGINHYEVFQMMTSGYNIFLSGIAGSGKSVCIERYKNYCDLNNKSIAILNPTSLLSMDNNGETYHSFLNISPNQYKWNKYKKNLSKERLSHLKNKIQSTKVFVLEEFGMFSEVMFDYFVDMIKEFSDLNRHQFIFVGDPGQLPPVVTPLLEKLYGYKAYNKAMNSLSFKSFSPLYIKLKYSYRNYSSKELKRFSNLLRKNELDVKFKTFKNLLSKAKHSTIEDLDVDNTICIVGTNREVKYINRLFQSKKEGKPVEFINDVDELDSRENEISKSFILKENEPIILTQSISKNNYFIVSNDKIIRPKKILPHNATGTFLKKTDKGVYISIKDEIILIPKPVPYHNHSNVATPNKNIKVYPFNLAYAFTSHKTQGITIDNKNVYIDFNKMDFCNQAYTSITRLTDFKQLIVPTYFNSDNEELFKFVLNKNGFKTSYDVKSFESYASYQEKITKKMYQETLDTSSNYKIVTLSSLPQVAEFKSNNYINVPLKIKDIKNYQFHQYENILVDDLGYIHFTKGISRTEFMLFVNRNINNLETNNAYAEIIINIILIQNYNYGIKIPFDVYDNLFYVLNKTLKIKEISSTRAIRIESFMFDKSMEEILKTYLLPQNFNKNITTVAEKYQILLETLMLQGIAHSFLYDKNVYFEKVDDKYYFYRTVATVNNYQGLVGYGSDYIRPYKIMETPYDYFNKFLNNHNYMYKKMNNMILGKDDKLEEFNTLNPETSVYYYTKEAIKKIRNQWNNTLLKRDCFDMGALYMNKLMMHSGNTYRELENSHYKELRYFYPQIEDVAKNIIKPLKGSVKSNNILQLARKKNIYKFREIEQSLYLDTPNNAYIEETMSNGFIDDFNNFIEVMEGSINAKENAPIAGFLDEFSIATAQVIRSIIDKINNWYPNLNGIL